VFFDGPAGDGQCGEEAFAEAAFFEMGAEETGQFVPPDLTHFGVKGRSSDHRVGLAERARK